jgi:hypothetical protein
MGKHQTLMQPGKKLLELIIFCSGSPFKTETDGTIKGARAFETKMKTLNRFKKTEIVIDLALLVTTCGQNTENVKYNAIKDRYLKLSLMPSRRLLLHWDVIK